MTSFPPSMAVKGGQPSWVENFDGGDLPAAQPIRMNFKLILLEHNGFLSLACVDTCGIRNTSLNALDDQAIS